MQEIQKKIILKHLIDNIGSSKKTITTLKNICKDYSEKDINLAIEYGKKENFITILKHNYVEAKNLDFTIMEECYYDSIEIMINNYYHDKGSFLVSKTAKSNTKIAGRWTRPDFTAVVSRKFPYIRDPEFDIITYEVKRPADIEALAVFEALAHNSAATKSYVLFPVTQTTFDLSKQGERIREECVRHGIGMFLVENEFTLNNLCLIIEAQRRPLNPEKCSNFLMNVIDQKKLGKMTTWP